MVLRVPLGVFFECPWGSPSDVQMHLGRPLAPFGCLWVLLRVFWGLVEVLLSALGAPFGILGMPWAFLGPLWGPDRFLTLPVSIGL